MLAMIVNDNAFDLAERGALESIASKLAPTVIGISRNGVNSLFPAERLRL
ncbi:hypothetical protein [Pseudomonas fluorescens]|nr:hypothetical protein [Pseudomonas fluorescens]